MVTGASGRTVHTAMRRSAPFSPRRIQEIDNKKKVALAANHLTPHLAKPSEELPEVV
jgi:hypothetical protein